jgi:hypothetical protein
MDLNDPKRPVTFFQTGAGGAGVWGRAGVAIGTGGLVFVETGDGDYDPVTKNYSDSVLAFSAKKLELADYYTPANRKWITEKDLDMGCITPVVFPFKHWELVATGGKEGFICLLDAKSPGGSDHRTPLFRSPLYTNKNADFQGHGFWGAFATWSDANGVRWLYAPAWGPQAEASPEFPYTHDPAPDGSIMAFKVDLKDNRPVLTPAWKSRNMSVPEPPIVANGILFGLSNGENVRQDDGAGHIYSTQQRASAPSGNARLYAFDAENGQELYSSGETIPGWTHFSGLALSNGRIFVVTHDAQLYAFGLARD